MNLHSIVLTASCMALVLVSPASADPSPRDAEPALGPRVAQQNNPKLKKKRAEVRQRIRALRAWKLTEELKLDEATAARLFPIINRYDEKFEALTAENRRLRRQLEALLDSGKNDARTNKTIDQLIDRMTAQQQKGWDLQRARFGDVRKALTARQAARAFVLLPEIDRQLRRQIRRALNGKNPARQRRQKRRMRNQGGDLRGNPYK